MENKRFCDLKVGDNLYIYFETIIEKKINKIEKIHGLLVIENDFQTYFVQDAEKDFIIIEHVMDNGRITEAIATSMDRLLLEMEEN